MMQHINLHASVCLAVSLGLTFKSVISTSVLHPYVSVEFGAVTVGLDRWFVSGFGSLVALALQI